MLESYKFINNYKLIKFKLKQKAQINVLVARKVL